MTVVVAMPITTPNRLSVKLIFLRLKSLVVMELEVSFLNYTTGYTYIFTTGYMRRNLAPLDCHFNSNRNRRIVELSCLYCHLFYLLSFCRGREIIFLR